MMKMVLSNFLSDTNLKFSQMCDAAIVEEISGNGVKIPHLLMF